MNFGAMKGKMYVICNIYSIINIESIVDLIICAVRF